MRLIHPENLEYLAVGAAVLGTALGAGIISQAKMEVGNEQGTR